jgi:4'-phosphopantetheinyl transferase
VWRVDLAAVDEDSVELLSPEEGHRAQAIIGQRERRLWMRSRGVLRVLLGRYLHEDPGTLRFVAAAHGKPELLDTAGGGCKRTARPWFNLSHSGGLALYAFSGSGSVGIDLESARRPLDVLAVANRVFGPEEALRLQGLDPSMRQLAFLRAWTRHEAALKCRGSGLGAREEGTTGPGPWVLELDLGPQAAGALAAERPAAEVRCWDWQA